MSINLDQVLVKEFENEAIQAFQDAGKLRDTVRIRDAAGAQQVQFQVIGATTTQERGAIHTMIPLADATHTPATATVKNYVVSEMTDIFLGNQVKFDERQELVESFGASLGRRIDQAIIDALDAHSFTQTVAKNISGSNDNLNVAMMLEAAKLLGSDVPEENRSILCHDNGYYHFLNEDDVKSIDFNDMKTLPKAAIRHYAGFDIYKMADRSEGGLALSTNDRTNYAWQRQAIGLAMNMQPKIEINYEPSFGAHRVTGMVSLGAVIIQDSGVVKITSDES